MNTHIQASIIMIASSLSQPFAFITESGFINMMTTEDMIEILQEEEWDALCAGNIVIYTEPTSEIVDTFYLQ